MNLVGGGRWEIFLRRSNVEFAKCLNTLVARCLQQLTCFAFEVLNWYVLYIALFGIRVLFMENLFHAYSLVR